MSSSVYFKFKSQKEPTRVEFDGTGISVFELKRDIIVKSGLGDGTDFDLAIYTEDGKEGKQRMGSEPLPRRHSPLTNDQNTTMTQPSSHDPRPSWPGDCRP